MAGEKKKGQDQPDQAVIHPIVSRARMRFRSATSLLRPRNLEAETLHGYVLNGMGSFMLWVDTSEESSSCQCEGKGAEGKPF
jgi:hypothetical protein